MGLDSLINEAKRNGGHASITFHHREIGVQPSLSVQTLSVQLRQAVDAPAGPSNRQWPFAIGGIPLAVSPASTRAQLKHRLFRVFRG